MKNFIFITLSILLLCHSNGVSNVESQTVNVPIENHIDIEKHLRPKLQEVLSKQPEFLRYNNYLTIDVEGEIYELEPFIVTPRQTLQQKIDKDLRENTIYFSTSKGMVDEYLKDLPAWDKDFLNRFTLPFFGISKEVRAKRRAAEIRQMQHISLVKRFLDVKREFNPREHKQLLETYYIDMTAD